VLTEIEKFVLLAPDKRKVMEGILDSLLSDYREDFDKMFSFEWVLQGYYSMIPFMVLTDEQMVPALNKEQIAIIRGRNPGHFGNMIDNLKKSHEARIKAEKE
jgi:hypothetical protein